MSDIIKGTEERFESKLELLKSSLSGDLAKLDNVPTTTTLVLAVIGGVVTGMGLVLALLAYGNDRFSTGSQFTMGTYEQSAAALKASEDAKRLSDDLSRDVRALTDAVRRAMDRQEAPRDVPRQTPQP